MSPQDLRWPNTNKEKKTEAGLTVTLSIIGQNSDPNGAIFQPRKFPPSEPPGPQHTHSQGLMTDHTLNFFPIV